MHPSTNTQSGPKTSTKTLALFPTTSSYVTQTALDNTINAMFEKLKDEFDKQYEKLESMNELIANQDEKIYKKIKEEIQTM